MSFKNIRLASFEKPRSLNESRANTVEPESLMPRAPALPHGVVQLAKTVTFSVSLLPGIPNIEQISTVSRGSVDWSTEYALLSANDAAYVWKVNPAEPSPNALGFTNKDVTSPAWATLIAPITGERVPGLLKVENTGDVAYWQSVDSAIADGLFEKGNSLGINLKFGTSETVRALARLDPVGAVVATSSGRLFLLRLVDQYGKHSLKAVTMKDTSGGLMSSLAHTVFNASWRINIVSVQAGPNSIDGTDRLIYTLTAAGWVSVWKSALNGTVSLVTDDNVGQRIQNEVELLYPQFASTHQFHDIASDAPGRVHILASFRPSTKERFYLIITIQIDVVSPNKQVSLLSTYRLQSYTADAAEPPKLQFPDSTSSIVYATFDDAIVMIDTAVQRGNAQRWEDIVVLKNNVRLFGVSPSLDGVLVSTITGILDVKTRLPEIVEVEDGDDGEQDPIRTSLVQAILFERKSSPISFNPRNANSIPEKDLTAAFESLAVDLAQGNVKRVSSSYPSLNETLRKRLTQIKALAIYAKEQYDLPVDARIIINNVLQQTAAADSLWSSIDESPALKARVAQFRDGDPRRWFRARPLLVTGLMAPLSAEPKYVGPVVKGLVAADRASRAVGLVSYRESLKGATVPPLFASDEIFNITPRLSTFAEEVDDSALMVETVEFLCAAYIQRETWTRDMGSKSERRLNKTRTLSEESKLLDMLSSRGLRSEAITIAEQLHLIQPLAWLLADDYIADSARQSTAFPSGESSTRRIYKYIDDFGYEFAREVFRRLADQNALQALETGFLVPYRAYVRDFLLAPESNLARVAWVVQLQDKFFDEVPRTLSLAVSQEQSSINNRRILSSLQKLSALATDQPGLVSDADAELNLMDAQQLIFKEFAVGGRSLIVNASAKRGVSQLLLEAGTPVVTNELILSTQSTLDLLTFLKMSSTLSEGNFPAAIRVFAFAPASEQFKVRFQALAQQIVLLTDWETILQAPNDAELDSLSQKSLLHRVLDSSGLQVQHPVILQILSPRNWKVPTDHETLARVYDPDGTEQSLVQHLSQDFATFNSQVDQLQAAHSDIEKLVRAIASKVYIADAMVLD